jgi:hypothetical protein
MGYADGRYQARHDLNLVGLGSVTIAAATYTGTGALGTYADFMQKKVPNRCRIEGAKAYIVVAPTSNHSGGLLAMMTGTTTIGVATIGTNTAGVTVNFTITAANAFLSANDQIDIDIIGTATASATAGSGNYNIDVAYTELQA